MIRELAGKKNLRIQSYRAFGRRFRRVYVDLSDPNASNDHHYFALIYDCGSDSQVTSEVRDHYERLVSEGYGWIVAVRDVAPKYSRTDIPKVLQSFSKYTKSDPIAPQLILATMETEAWFMAEHTHFQKIDPSLTVPFVQERLGFDLANDDLEGRANPARDLERVYDLVGLRYSKSKADVERTVDSLDFQVVAGPLGSRVPSLSPLIAVVSSFLGEPPLRSAITNMMSRAVARADKGSSILAPKILEPRRRQLGVPHRVLDVFVAEIGLQCPRVVPVVGELVTAGMSQHVRVGLEAKLGFDPRPLHHPGKSGRAKRRAALRGEHKGRRRRLLALKAT